MLKVVLILLLIGSFGCSESSDSQSPESTTGATGTTDSDDLGFRIPTPKSKISCENACKRPPSCEEELGTEADCMANCDGSDDSDTYACCIQFAEGCAEVEKCITSIQPKCSEEGDPWVPLAVFDQCLCGDPENPPPDYNECAKEGGDTPCETGLCLKPVNYKEPPFCAIECDSVTNPCPEPYVCAQTPKKNYCKRPFG